MIVKTGPDSIAFYGDPPVRAEQGGATADYDHGIHSNPDARAWARFFMETYNRNQWAAPDEEMMAGWFANAMMAMHDHVRSDLDAALARAEEAERERDAAEERGRRDGEANYIERHGSCPHKQARMKAEAALATMYERATEAESSLASERMRSALRLIRDFPIPEQDNMVAANMREVARAALASAPASREEK